MEKKSGKLGNFKNKITRGLVAGALALGVTLTPGKIGGYQAGTEADPSIHPLLAQKLYDFYPNKSDFDFDVNGMRRGAINEDANDKKKISRSMNHFMHWKTNEGLNGYSSALDWLNNGNEQAKYAYGDHSWARVVDDIKNGKTVGENFGYAYHLVADMTVPAHVRGDIHPPGEQYLGIYAYPLGLYSDPFEAWTHENKSKIMNQVKPQTVPSFNSIDDLMKDLAYFTGSNFYSSDSVDGTITGLTEIKEGQRTYFVKTIDSKDIKIVRKGFLTDFPDTACFASQWPLLGTKAVEYGAGALEILRKQNPTSTCTSHSSKVCFNGDVYWKDSCGKLEEMFDSCNSNESCVSGVCKTNQPTCTSHSSKVCNNGDVYWKDSCGKLEELAQSCNSNQNCENGSCVNNNSDLFIDQGNETVKNVQTNDIWQKISQKDSFSYDNAKNYCATLNLGGSNNWRLPTLDEFITLYTKTGSKNGSYIYSIFEGPYECYWTNSCNLMKILCDDNFKDKVCFGFNIENTLEEYNQTGEWGHSGDPSYDKLYVRCIKE